MRLREPREDLEELHDSVGVEVRSVARQPIQHLVAQRHHSAVFREHRNAVQRLFHLLRAQTRLNRP